MATKSVSHEDLLAFTKQETEARHALRGELQKYYNIVDDLKETSIITQHILKEVGSDLTELKTLLISHMKEEENSIKAMIESMDKKYAAKWTEKVLTFVGTGVGTSIIGALMYLLLKH